MRSAEVRTRSGFRVQDSAAFGSMATDEPSDYEDAALDEEVEREMWRTTPCHGARAQHE